MVHVFVRAAPAVLFTTQMPMNLTDSTATTEAVTQAMVTADPNVTTPDPRAENGGPYIEFTADFTSYFLGMLI